VNYWDLTPRGRVPAGSVFVRAATEADALERIYIHGEGLFHWTMQTGLPETFVRLSVVAAQGRFSAAERKYMAQFPEDPAKKPFWPFGVRFAATKTGDIEPFHQLDENAEP
jgi:hypothetical protein